MLIGIKIGGEVITSDLVIQNAKAKSLDIQMVNPKRAWIYHKMK
jgi:hypothetical protein